METHLSDARMETTSRDSFFLLKSWNVAGRSNFVGARHKAGARLARQLQVGRVMAPSPNPESPLSFALSLSLSLSVAPLTPCLPLLSPHLQLMALE